MILLINKEGRLKESNLEMVKEMLEDRKYEVEIISTEWGKKVKSIIMNRTDIVNMIIKDKIEFFYLNEKGKIIKMTKNNNLKIENIYFLNNYQNL